LTTKDTAPKLRPPFRKGVELELEFTDLLANGQGVGRAESLVVFSFGPLPHELARVRLTAVKQRYAVAQCVRILRESPARARPFCPVFGTCGGCQLQHLDYPAQLGWKRSAVAEAIARIGGIHGADVRETIGMRDPRAYRNKMSLVVDRRKNPPALGFYKQRSHDVVPIDACPIVTPKLDADLHRLNSLRQTPAVAEMLEEARHLVARSSDATGESVLTITTARQSEKARCVAPELLHDVPGLLGVTNSFDLAGENAILGRQHRTLAGNGEIDETIAGVRYRISAGSFFQVNAEIVSRIFAHVAPWLEQRPRIVDLYSGVGTFALFFAKHGCAVRGVEENEQAVAEAAGNARRNGLEDLVCFTTGRVEELVASAALRGAFGEADVAFLDPPRKGCDEAVLAALAAARVRAVWYLSCDPATLARDSKFLVAKGYRLGTVQPFDMFPQTGHIEALAQLEYS
jgi:23S rRNA (uracil1939-C5)-methyltransferase